MQCIKLEDKLELCIQLQSYSLIGITETLWDSSHGWSAAITEMFGLEGTSPDHLVQPHCSSSIRETQLPRTVSSQI